MSSVSTTTSLLSSVTSTSTSSSSSSSSTSSIDWSGLIEEAVNAKLAKADSIDVKVSNNELKIAAYESASSLLSDMLTAAQSLRSPSGTLAKADDAYLARSAYLTANGSVDAASALSATVDTGTGTGSYKLEILQLAQAHKVSSASQSDSTSDLGLEGSLTLGIEGGTSLEISVDASMSLAEIAEAINNVKSSSGVQASIVKVSGNDYRLILSSVETGQTIVAGSPTGSDSDILQELGITDSSGAFTNVVQESQQAIIELDDIQITRSSNDIDDVLEGVTFYLYETTPSGTSITLEIGANVSTVKTAIQSLVDAYNAYREFAVSQQTLPGSSDESVLFGDGTLRSINTSIGTALASIIDRNSMSLLGLSFDENNYLVLDDTVLDNALLTDLDAVQSLLAFQMSSSSSKFLLLARGTTVPPAFTVDIAVDASGAITSASVNGDASLFTVSGTRIIGAAGGPYEGFTFVYAGKTAMSVDVSFSSGIAEMLYNVANVATNSSTGTLTGLISDLEDYNDQLTTKSEDIRSRAETYRTNLTNRYAKYQAAIAAAESSQTYLQQLIDTWNASS